MSDNGQGGSGDPTADAGIDVGQKWRHRALGITFTIERTYRDNPIDPSFLIKYDAPSMLGHKTVRLRWLSTYAERVVTGRFDPLDPCLSCDGRDGQHTEDCYFA